MFQEPRLFTAQGGIPPPNIHHKAAKLHYLATTPCLDDITTYSLYLTYATALLLSPFIATAMLVTLPNDSIHWINS